MCVAVLRVHVASTASPYRGYRVTELLWSPVPQFLHVQHRGAGRLVHVQACGLSVVLRKQVGTAVPAQGNIATRAWEGALGPATSRARPRTPSRAPERPPVRGVRPGSLALGEGGVPLWSRLVPPGELWPGDEHCPGETPKELLSAQVLCVSDCS